MDECRKSAYRALLYRAMLDIRPVAWLRLRNPLRWGHALRRVRYAGDLADWLHNMAFFSSMDFDQFDEEWFWREARSLKGRYPEFDIERYHQAFEQRLSELADG